MRLPAVGPTVFASARPTGCANLDYPLLLPSLHEAIGFRAMGAFTGARRLVHCAVLALPGRCSCWRSSRLLRDRGALPWCSGFLASSLAVWRRHVTFDRSTLTACAGISRSRSSSVSESRRSGAGCWRTSAGRSPLATFCFAGALLMKNEGSLFSSRGVRRAAGCRSPALARARGRGCLRVDVPCPASVADLRSRPPPRDINSTKPRRQLRLRRICTARWRWPDRVPDPRRARCSIAQQWGLPVPLFCRARSWRPVSAGQPRAYRPSSPLVWAERRSARIELDLRDLALRVQLLPSTR